MSGPEISTMARDERADLADLLATLTEEQWDVPSLCAGWRVRDVAAHLISYEALSGREVVRALVAGRLRFGTVNERLLAPLAALPSDELLALFRDCLQPRGLTAAMGGRIALTDGLIHHQDIRRPLGLPRTVPPDRLRAVLAFAVKAPVLPAGRLASGLRLVADDLGLTRGSGPEVVGSAEALLMAIAGRAAAVDELTGDGVPELRRRLARPH